MNRRIRVAHCIETVHLGGVEQTRLAIATGLDPERFEQILICTKALGALPDRFRAAGCPVHTIGSFERRIDWAAIGRAQRILAAFQPDIVHGGVYEGVVTAAIAGRRARVPIVIGEETSDPLGRRWTGHLFLRGLAMLCDRFVAVSPFVADYLLRTLRLPARKVVTIDNGVPESEPTAPEQVAKLKAALSIAEGDFVIGTVSRLSEWHKRVGDAVRAVAILRERHPALRLLIVGEGPDEPALRALASELDIADRVIFAGYQPDTRQYFDCMDIFVHVPSSEAFGLVLVEAMFASLPVVASRVGGIPGVVADGQTGILVDRYNPEQTAAAIARLIEDADTREQFGRAGLKRARDRFSQQRYVADIERLYRGVVEEKLGSADRLAR